MRLAALVLLCVPFTLRASPLDPQLSAQLEMLRHGKAPTILNAELASETKRLIQKLEFFGGRFAANNNKLSTNNCARYNVVVRDLTKDLAQTLTSFTGVASDVNDPAAIDAYVRLQVAIPSFERLAQYFGEAREGGFGFIDLNQKQSCPYANRQSINAYFQDMSQTLASFQQRAVGAPGLLDLERTTERLLTLAIREETHEGRTSLAVNLGLLAAQWAGWKFGAPVLKGSFEKMFGNIGLKLASKKWFQRTIYVAATVADFQAQGKFNDLVNPQSAQRRDFDPSQIQIRFPTWEENIGDIERLVQSSFHQPQLYLAYLTTLTAQLARVIQKWAREHEVAIKAATATDPELAARVSEMAYLNREAIYLNDTIPSVAAQKLPQLLANDWKMNLDCGAGQLIGTAPSWVQCLIGTRRVARALYAGLLTPPDEAVAAITMINVTTRKKFSLATTETDVRVELPYKQPSARVAEYIARAYQSREVNARRKLLAQYSITLENFSQNAAQTIDFDPKLTLRERWTALGTLLEMQQREPGLLAHADVGLFVTKAAAPISESHLGLRVSIAALASYDETALALKTSLAEDKLNGARRNAETLRQRIQVLGQSVKDRWGVDVRCDDTGRLTLAQCLHSVKRLKKFALDYPNVRPAAAEIRVMGHGTPSGQFGLMRTNEDKPVQVFAVRYGFKSSQLHSFILGRRWFTEN